MINDQTYIVVMVSAACSMLITGLMLALVKEPADTRAAKFSVAKWALTVAVVLLGMVNLVQVAFDDDGDMSYLGPCIALSAGFFQAMLFTNALMTLVRPEQVTLTVVLRQLAVIAAVDAALIVAFALLPSHLFIYTYYPAIVLYLVLMACYVRWFRRGYVAFYQHIEQYYEEEEIARGTRWMRFLFRAAVAVGLLSLLMLFNHRDVDLCLTVAIALLYALFAASFINYGLLAPVILPAIYGAGSASPRQPKTKLSQLDLWIKDRGYLDNNKAVADIAAEVGMSVDQLHRYFRDVMGEEFRTWRVRRRIDEAKRLMAEHPELSTTQIGKQCGFNDRSFFYQQFLRFAGTSVPEYRKGLKD